MASAGTNPCSWRQCRGLSCVLCSHHSDLHSASLGTLTHVPAADLQEQDAESTLEAVGLPVPLADGSTGQISRASGSQRPLFVLDAHEQRLLPEPGNLALAPQAIHPELLSRCLL